MVGLDLTSRLSSRYLVCYDGLTLGCSCRESLARQAGGLGGEVEFREDSLAIGDFRVGVSLQGSANSRIYM